MTITTKRTGKHEWAVTIDGVTYRCPAVLSEADAIRCAQSAAKWSRFSAVRR